MNRSIHRLFTGLTIGFVALAVMLGYWQVIAADDLSNHGDNTQALRRDLTVDRGRILLADGTVAARSVSRKVEGQTVYRRVYDDGTLAPHVIGYAVPEQGKTGLELEYNNYLSGSYGVEPILQRLRLRTARGATVETTLVPAVQRIANQQLIGRRGAVVAMDPTTGAVLAMASSPGFDLAKVATRKGFAEILKRPDQPLFNRATMGRYPPGSTFKVVTTTAALEANVGITPTTRFDDTGVFRTPGPDITNFGNERFGEHTLSTALTKSVNTTFAQIGTTLGADRLGATMDAFGFGEVPPIDLPSGQVEASGRMRNGKVVANDEQGEDVARIAIGQERLAVTPLQMAMVASAIANDGTLMRPYLMSRVLDRGNSAIRETRPEELSQVASPANAKAVAQMMSNVVREGTGTAAALTGFAAAGKTGTAETAVNGINDAWFIGFAPVDSPRVAVAVVIEGTTETGGAAAAPVAREVMQSAITELR